ncbi:polysaccharide deacetylase family protein [Paenibacillus alvei]|uniref:Polysaccharide deacetylase family sporulation protein PdaB n=1 Tax=Paenibacillus alvei TaxID=44250 RepID=A0A383RG47_PAEAL|nr:polysaccharide deacetylase family protein [Paenibacillus alvei]SYX85319.1 Polysaccharide deacetylase family sporulation protein PdaB [Paenibacillus alvei]
MNVWTEAVYRVDTKRKCIALTFDIGWGSRVPPSVLRALVTSGVKKATFFFSSPWAAKHPRIAKKIKASGYEIGSHGKLHENYTEHSNSWIAREVKLAASTIRNVTGVRCRLIRTPNGDLNRRVTTLLGKLGYSTIHWSVDSMDWTNPGVSTIIKNTTSRVATGDIVLLHASDSARQTAKALPIVIRKLRQQGFAFVTVSELLRMRAK